MVRSRTLSSLLRVARLQRKLGRASPAAGRRVRDVEERTGKPTVILGGDGSGMYFEAGIRSGGL